MSTEPSLKWHRERNFYRWNLPSARCGLGPIAVFAFLFLCAALVFAWRRVSGALVRPLSPALLISSGLLAAISALGIRTLWRRSSDRKASAQGNLVLDILLGASLLIFGVALSLPGTNAVGLGVLWLLIAAFEIGAWRPRAGQWFRRSWRKESVSKQFRLDHAQSVAAHFEHDSMLPGAISDSLTAPVLPATGVTQQLTRSTTADGCDVLSGWLRLDLAPSQRTGNLHVAFCPPFAGTPELTAVQLDGPEARIKIAQLLPYGARLDVKLIALNKESACVLVQFTAIGSL